MKTRVGGALAAILLFLLSGTPASAQPLFITTGLPDARLGMASNPAGGGMPSRQAADDFLLPRASRLTGATFTGLVPAAVNVAVTDLVVAIYRVFPLDAQDPPSGRVPARGDSPGDVALVERSSGSGLTFTPTVVGAVVVPNMVIDGIHPAPGNLTGGDGNAGGAALRVDVTFTRPIDLPAGHYFVVPQVGLSDGIFLWLSAARPIAGPGTTPFAPDLETWMRDERLAPDWLRVGTDVIGGGETYNAAFSLAGVVIPEPSPLALVAPALAALAWRRRRRA